jgi:DNA topoisomerase-3
MALTYSEEDKNWKLEFDFGDEADPAQTGELIDFGAQEPLGPCPKCAARVFEFGKNYVCEKSVPTPAQATPSCDFKSGQIILQQPIEREQMQKLLATGKTDLLDKFVSMRTRRAFKAFLAWDAEAGKVNFAFEPRASKYPPRKTSGAPTRTPFGKVAAKKAAPAKKAAAKKAPAAKKAATPKAPRKPSAGLKPSAALAAVIGPEAVARTEVIKKLWDYIKANGLQDATNKRAINADDKLRAVFGKPQVTMFELAGIVGKHLESGG